MHTGFTGHVLDAARLAIGIETQKDVTPREILERSKGALHITAGHTSQNRTRLEGRSAAVQGLNFVRADNGMRVG